MKKAKTEAAALAAEGQGRFQNEGGILTINPKTLKP